MNSKTYAERILVTGGAGFIGSHLVEALLQCTACKLTVLDNLSRGKLENLPQSPRLEMIEGDIRDRLLLERITEGAKVVYHLAAQASVLRAVEDPDLCFQVNVAGTYEALRAAARAGVPRFVFTSSREVYGEPEQLPVSEIAPINPTNVYGTSKAAAELYCEAFRSQGLHSTVLRLSNVYGTRDTGRVIPEFINKALSGQPIRIYGAEKVIDFIWVKDVVQMLIAASQCSVSPINVGSGIGTRLTEVASRIGTLTGSSSLIEIESSRAEEVNKFTADNRRAVCALGYESSPDPLQNLPVVVRYLTVERECLSNSTSA